MHQCRNRGQATAQGYLASADLVPVQHAAVVASNKESGMAAKENELNALGYYEWDLIALVVGSATAQQRRECLLVWQQREGIGLS